ncbi:MAG: TylF/MycF/NovP-related O-methyltransferase [Candidatus Woesearchaeota archaeon]
MALRIGLFQSVAKLFGYKILPIHPKLHPDMDREFRNIYDQCKHLTMTPIERMYSLYESVKYVEKAGIPGDFVECGVWKGGSAMVIALALQQLCSTNRKIFLYDTYTGMAQPTQEDKLIYGNLKAINRWKKEKKRNYNTWCFSPLEEVKRNLFSTGYPRENLVFVKGRVENTIPLNIPQNIALLRLDTDWYQSTLHELKYLFPILEKKGVLIIDDYGHWEGARKAVDEYLMNKGVNILLNRIDYGCRVAIK